MELSASLSQSLLVKPCDGSYLTVPLFWGNAVVPGGSIAQAVHRVEGTDSHEVF